MTRLYVALERALLIIEGGAGGWQAAETLVGTSPQCLAADPSDPAMLYCGTFGDGLWRTRDVGRTWTRAGDGIPHAEVTAVAVSRTERVNGHGVVFAGTEPTTVSRSEDAGDTWRRLSGLEALPSRSTWSFPPRPYTHHARWIEPDQRVVGRVFVCVERGGVMRSLDGGATWADRRTGAPMDVHTMRTHPLAPNRAYAACGDGYVTPGEGYAESRDAGESWQRFAGGLRHHYLWSVAVDPADPEKVVVSAARGPGEAHQLRIADSTIYRRSGGSDWQEIRDGLPEPLGSFAAPVATNEAEPGVFYLASNRGVYRSGDAGLSWERLDVDWPESYRQQHPAALVVTG